MRLPADVGRRSGLIEPFSYVHGEDGKENGFWVASRSAIVGSIGGHWAARALNNAAKGNILVEVRYRIEMIEKKVLE